MLKPRSLPPAHKNQLSVPVKSFGFFNDPRRVPQPVFRHHEVSRKKLWKHKPSTGFPLPTSSSLSHHESTSTSDEENASVLQNEKSLSPTAAAVSKKRSISTLIHIRGRASMNDVTTLASNSSSTLNDVTSSVKSPAVTSPREEDYADNYNNYDEDEEDEDVGLTPFLTEDPMTSRSYDSTGSTSTIRSSSLDCSKYTVIGDSRSRKKRAGRSMWSLPKAKSEDIKLKTNTQDLRSIYGSRSKLQQVPSTPKREETIILPPLEIGRRRREVAATLDSDYLAEKRLVMAGHAHPHPTITAKHPNPHPGSIYYRRVPAAEDSQLGVYKPYFRHRQRNQRFVRTLFSGDNEYASPTTSPTPVTTTTNNNNNHIIINNNDNLAAGPWESHSEPVHCLRCVHQSSATLQYCDVLGRSFCRFCNELSQRALNLYEGKRPSLPSPFKSSMLAVPRLRDGGHNSTIITNNNDNNHHHHRHQPHQPTTRPLRHSPLDPLQVQPELSFVGVRKVVITKTVKEESQGHDNKGQSFDQEFGDSTG